MAASTIDRNAISAQDWNAIVASSPEGCHWASHEWQDEICAIAEWRLADASFGLEQDGRLVGVVPLQVASRGSRVLMSTGFGQSGPVLQGDLGAPHRRRLWRQAFDEMRTVASRQRCQRITVALPPMTDAALGNRWGVSPFFEWGMADESTCTSVIDLSLPVDSLWKGLDVDARSNIRRAEREGVRVEEVAWKDHLDDYYAVHVETYRRTGVSPHPRRYFEAVARMAEKGHYRLWMASDGDGRPLAFHNAAQFRKGAQYNTGCNSERALTTGAGYLLAWTAILACREAGKAWFEMGEIVPPAIGGKSRSLAVFKGKFGGELHRFFRGSYDLPRSPDTSGPTRRLARAFKRTLELALPGLGAGKA